MQVMALWESNESDLLSAVKASSTLGGMVPTKQSVQMSKTEVQNHTSCWNNIWIVGGYCVTYKNNISYFPFLEHFE